MLPKKYAFSQSGQVGIAVILVMVVMSTIGISLATRSATNIQTARQSQEATQTFSAAESALEEILSQDETFLQETDSGQFTEIENIDVNYSIERETVLTTDLIEGETAEVDISGSSAGNAVVIEWAESTDCGTSPASILVNVVGEHAGAPISRMYGLTICNRSDGMYLVTQNGQTLARRVVLALEAGDSLVRITPVYNDTQVLVFPSGWTLPTQKFTISSVAENQTGRETKAIEVERTAEYTPGILDYALVSGTTIIK